MPSTDGSLIFNTKIDISGVNKGSNEVNKKMAASANTIQKILGDTEKTAKSKASSIAAEYKKMGESQAEALKRACQDAKGQGEQFSTSVTESFQKTEESAASTTRSIGDSFKEFGNNLMQSRDWITMIVKVVVGELKMMGDVVSEVAETELAFFQKTAQGIGRLSAEAGKFTLKQFIGDWEDNNSSMKRLLMTAASAFSVYKLVDFGKSGIALGSDLAEVQNVVDVTFSHMTDKVDEWAKKAQNAYGLSETMAKKFVGLYGSMSEAFGFTETQAFEMASTLSGLAGDVASFYNIDQELAYTKLKSVFSGETETLKDLGIVMTENALNDYAMRKGLGKTVSKMSEAEKVTLRYQFVLDQLNNAAGDFTRTQDSWANQTRILSLRFDTLKATVGRGLINALTPVLKLVNKLVEGLQKVAEWFEHFSIAVFGRSTGTTGAVTEGLDAAADSADSLSDSLDDVREKSKALRYDLASYDELNIITDNGEQQSAQSLVDEAVKASGIIEKTAADAKKKAEGTLSGISFSKAIQKAIKNDNWRGVGLLIASEINEKLKKIPWRTVKEKAVDLASKIGEFINGAFMYPDLWITIGHTLAEGFNTAIAFLLTLLKTIDFSKIGFDFAEMLNEFLKTFDAEGYGELVAEQINAIFDFLAGFAFDFDWAELGNKIGDALASYFQNLNLTKPGKSGKTIPETIAGLINGLIQAGIRLLTYEFTDENGEVRNLWEYVGSVLGEGLNNFLENFNLNDAIKLIKSGIKAFIGMIYNAFAAIAGKDGNGFKRLGDNLAKGVNNWLGDTDWWAAIGKMIGEIINDILDFVIHFIGNLDVNKLISAINALLDAMNIGLIFTKLREISSNLFALLREVLHQQIGKLLRRGQTTLINTLMDMLRNPSKLLQPFKYFWELIKEVFKPVTNWFRDTFSEAWRKVKDVFSSGGRIFQGIKDGIAEVFKGVVNHIIDGINTVVSNTFRDINQTISAIRDFEVFGKKPFSFVQTIAVPQIPKLATGTVVPANYGEFLAVLGDNKREREFVSPESSMKKMFLEALAESGYSQNENRPIYVNVVLPDGTVLFKTVAREDDIYAKTHGRSRFERRQYT